MSNLETNTTKIAEKSQLWQNKNFVALLLGQVSSNLGTQLTEFVVPILILEMYKSAVIAGFVGAAQQIPYLIFGLFAGVLADRIDRKKIMVFSNIIRSIALLSLAIGCIFNTLTLTHIVIVVIISGIAFVFFDASENAAFPKIVSQRDLPKAASLTEGFVTITELLGPSLGGLFLVIAGSTLLGAGYTFGFDAITYMFFAMMILRIRVSLQDPTRLDALRNTNLGYKVVFTDAATGMKFLWNHVQLRQTAFSNMINCLLLAPLGLVVIYFSKHVLMNSTTLTGLIFTIGGLSAIVGSLLTERITQHFSLLKIMVLSNILWGLGATVVSWSHGFLQLVIGWGLISFIMPVYFSVLYAYRMRIIPDDLRGRVGSVYRVMAQSGSPIGLALGGLMLNSLGAQVTAFSLAIAFILNLVWIYPLNQANKNKD
ncbi:MFS family permease [Paenibacillus shirakamiensis]|uniref:MFS family permease n=1 Tax=Paenibacillus shirakamiensis TaxID=1265935 RepID=A0ABS4JDY5_9BACL|nr:MFS transporter [Paenibacillus shirakamiensis]MBP1999938.1 MFS family permease [Paenibacillus shirakamiensis]